ncbi:MAG: nucleoside hydrolase [Spirochaetia bacterium]|nr:nucleoside hydrolase [Spirochaetia bacterium]MCF7940609.1 nucleoside hydrolase [Spirochaetia bacterium]
MREHQKSDVRPRAVLDTDTFNEIDDQFALAYLLRAEDVVKTEAIYAAPFRNDRAASAGEGMRKSHEEIGRLLDRLGRDDIPSYAGSSEFLTDTGDAERSDAVEDLIRRSVSASAEDPLQIIAIGALTNIASAILIEPEVVNRCRVIWLGGNDLHWPDNREFNLQGDIAAVKVVYDSGIPLTVVPCMGVSSHLTSSREELSAYMDTSDPLCSFLYQRFSEYLPEGMGTKEIWDVAAVAALVLPDALQSYSTATPRIAEDGSYIQDPRRKLCRWVYHLDRDAIYADLYRRLGSH